MNTTAKWLNIERENYSSKFIFKAKSFRIESPHRSAVNFTASGEFNRENDRRNRTFAHEVHTFHKESDF